MADRMPPYQMNSQNMMQNFIPQQQMQQQPQQQQQQQDSQMVSGLPNPEQHGRMWTPLQNNYRGQPNVDTNSTQMNPQMADLARNQALSHGHSSQGPLVQHIQQQYGLSSQRVPSSNPSFHDAQSSNPPPSNIPPNFSSIPMNTPQMKAGNTIQPLGNRSLHLMDRVSNQQNQHQPQTAMALARMQHQMNTQPGSSQPTPSDMFSTSNMTSVDALHGSPHLAPQLVGPQMGHPNMMPGRAPSTQKIPTLPELMQRREYLQTAITNMEQGIQNVLAQTGGFPDENWTGKLDKMRTELHNRKALFVRVNQAIQQLTTNNNVYGGNTAHLNPMATATGRPGVMQGGGASQQSWSQSSNPPSNFGLNPGANGPPQIPTQGQTHPMNAQLSGQAGQMSQRPGGVPPRSGPTPQQLPTGMANMMPQNMAPQFNLSSVSNGQVPSRFISLSTFGVSALDKARFEMMYTSYCKGNHMEPNLRVLLPENRSVDLHNLHVHVFREGGGQLVTQHDLWAVVGGRMGLVQFPGTDTEPAKSGPGIAQQLAHVYKEHLQPFETAYVLTVRSRTTPKNILPQNGTPGSASGSTGEMQHGVMRNPLSPQIMANAVRFVNMSVTDMRASGLPEQMILTVDRYRPEIIRWQQSRLMAAKANQQMTNPEASGEQPGMPSAPQGTFPNQVPTAGPSMVPGSRGQPSMMSNGGMQPQIAAEMKPTTQSGSILPTQEQLSHAMNVIQSTKQVFSNRLMGMQSNVLPDDQRMEYSQLLEQVFKMTRDMESKLPMYYIVLRSDDIIRKLVAIVLTVAHQRSRCSTGSPQYIIGLHTLKTMYMQVQKANEEFEQRFQMMKAAVGSQQMGGPHINRQSQLTVPNVPPSAQPTPPQTLQLPQAGLPISRHPSVNHLQTGASQPPLLLSANVSQPSSQPPPPQPLVKKPTRIPPSPSVPAATTTTTKVPSPTPPPANSASAAPTPVTAASPQTPKSPKSKQPPKAKTGHRTPKPPMTSPSETPPTFTAGVKRPADEDASTLPAAGPSTQPEPVGAPSPKKVKTEDWEEEPSEPFVKRHQEVDSLKTEEETTAFLDRMKELVAISASTDAGVYDDITHTLERILQGAGQDPTNIATPVFASSIGPPLSELSPPAGPPNDAFSEFHEFIDFSSLEDEEESKATTPDLVPSSTNPSPQSNPDADQSHQGASSPDKTKVEEPRDSNHLDLLHMGAFKEIDGGESAYYQPSDWKWEGPMTTLDPAWAIYQTS